MFESSFLILFCLLLPANPAPTPLSFPSSLTPAPLVPTAARPLKVITLERTACFGTCPIYKLTIFNDGKVIFEGKKFVRKIGQASGRITSRQVGQLINEFDNIYYFNLNDEYSHGSEGCPQFATDNPSAITSLTRNGKTKTIRHDHGCRGSGTLDLLTRLEDKIDEAVNVNQWLK